METLEKGLLLIRQQLGLINLELGVEAHEEKDPYTLLAVRQKIPPADRIEKVYQPEGVACVEEISKQVSVDPVMVDTILPEVLEPQKVKQLFIPKNEYKLVAYNCNVGLFATDMMTNPLIPRMVQLLSYARLAMVHSSDPQFVDYQSMAMAELMGQQTDNYWCLSQKESQEEIVKAVLYLNENRERLKFENWSHEFIGFYPNLQEWDVTHALVALEAMAAVLKPSELWLNNISFATNIITSLIQHGDADSKVAEEITEELNDLNTEKITLSPPLMKKFFKRYCNRVDANNVEKIYKHYQKLMPNEAPKLTEIIFTSGHDLIGYFTIVRAINKYSDFPWTNLRILIKQDFTNFSQAVSSVGSDFISGLYNEDSRASNFISLTYAAVQLCIKKGDKNLEEYPDISNLVSNKDKIDSMIADYVAGKSILLHQVSLESTTAITDMMVGVAQISEDHCDVDT